MMVFFDSHSGAIVAVSTIILMVITGFYAYFTWLLVQGMHKARAPFVVINFEFPDGQLRFVISNLGQMPARNVRFVVVQDLPCVSVSKKQGVKLMPVIINGISNLSPGKSLKYYAGTIHSIPKGSNVLDMEITYEDEMGKAYHRKETIDFAQYYDVMFESFEKSNTGIVNAIESLSRCIESKLTKNPFLHLTAKECPICAESIPIRARKCSHCGEKIENSDGATKEGI